MKAYKVELLIIDFDDLGEDGIKVELENTRFANDCMSPHVMNVEAREIGEWSDDNPLNFRTTQKAEYQRLFSQENE